MLRLGLFFLFFPVFYSLSTCSDGHLPLIDGDDPFPCSRHCPDGFQCENLTGLPQEVCCPNLKRLYELYGEDPTGEDHLLDVQQKLIEGKDPIRDPEKSMTNEELVTDENSGFKYSCARQNYEILCKNSTTPTQATIRWYREGDGCEYYPWGYCPGDLVIESTTIRTRKACEELCLSTKPDLEANGPIVFEPNETLSNNSINRPESESNLETTTFKIQPTTLEFPKPIESSTTDTTSQLLTSQVTTDSTSIKNTTIGLNLMANEVLEDYEDIADSKASDVENEEDLLDISKDPTGTVNQKDFGEFTVDKVGITIEGQESNHDRHVSCVKIPLRTMCESGMAAQFTWRWMVDESGTNCHSTPFGYCLNEENPNLPRTEEECRKFCLKK